MYRIVSILTSIFFLVGPAAAGSAAAGSAAAGEEELEQRVRFTSADEVELVGHFSPAGPKAPCALLVHDLGSSSAKAGWKKLGAALNDKGFAVLRFDFRGHGESTAVAVEAFWSMPANRLLIKGRPRAQIQFQDFDPAYYPVLVNDLAAAKAFLDRRNDAGACNSANLVVVAAGKGAALAALWLQAESHRHRLYPPMFAGQQAHVDADSEVKNVLGAVWLSMHATLGSRHLNVPALLDTPGRQQRVPMAFVYGAGDTQGRKLAQTCVKSLQRSGELPLTVASEVPQAETAVAEELLSAAPEAVAAIVEYAQALHERYVREWEERDVRNALYVWRHPVTGRLFQARNAGEQVLSFQTYEMFLK